MEKLIAVCLTLCLEMLVSLILYSIMGAVFLYGYNNFLLDLVGVKLTMGHIVPAIILLRLATRDISTADMITLSDSNISSSKTLALSLTKQLMLMISSGVIFVLLWVLTFIV